MFARTLKVNVKPRLRWRLGQEICSGEWNTGEHAKLYAGVKHQCEACKRLEIRGEKKRHAH